jgi:hypothetical protein
MKKGIAVAFTVLGLAATFVPEAGEARRSVRWRQGDLHVPTALAIE